MIFLLSEENLKDRRLTGDRSLRDDTSLNIFRDAR